MPPLPFKERAIDQQEATPSSPETPSPSPEEYVPKWKHIQEDLKYMFGIIVEHEEDITTAETQKKMYTKAIEDFLQGNPFSLEYFLEEDLLTPHSIKESDLPQLKKAATDMTYSMRHLARRTRSKELFIEAGILTPDEVSEIEELSNQGNN